MTTVVRIREADSDTVLASFPLTAMPAAGVSRDKLNSLTPQGLMPGAKTSASTTLKNSRSQSCLQTHTPTNKHPSYPNVKGPAKAIQAVTGNSPAIFR